MNKFTVIKVIIISIGIVGVIAVSSYMLRPKNTTLPVPIPSTQSENKTMVFEKQPSRTLKDYIESSGFSFKYPDDVEILKKDASDSATYASLELKSDKNQGSILIKIADSKLKSLGDWFTENKLSSSSADTKEIKIGKISGKEIMVNNKLIAVGLDQNILFTVDVESVNQKYWGDVYNTILSSFNFVPQQSSVASLDSSSGDAVLEEETIE